MTLRKHKGNRTFLVSFQNRIHTVLANKGNVGGWEKRGEKLSPIQTEAHVGNSLGGILRGFFFGRDRGNTVITCVRLAK